MDDTRRYGKFRVPAELARRFDTSMKRVMGLCIVFRAEHLFYCDEIEYFAVSEHFRPVPPGEMIPEYYWVIEDGYPHAEEVASGVAVTPKTPDGEPQ